MSTWQPINKQAPCNSGTYSHERKLKMIQIRNKGKMWWLYKGKKVVGFASTFKIAMAKARELEMLDG